jgi:formylglycine-generating enzyme required for sulfatase activity
VTSRYHGLSVELLEAEARYAGPSQAHAWRCGSPLPNDLGLFDPLGNVYEWCQEREYKYKYGMTKSSSDDIVDDTPRLCRGGAFTFLPAVARSARRVWNVPTDRNFHLGFRPARTYD